MFQVKEVKFEDLRISAECYADNGAGICGWGC